MAVLKNCRASIAMSKSEHPKSKQILTKNAYDFFGHDMFYFLAIGQDMLYPRKISGFSIAVTARIFRYREQSFGQFILYIWAGNT
ncbi:hypothetical protein D3870_04330 [Noviherbaspirillum cavernae]|uniref:Uncharacterized protein n=2 Tax=Noviherbaspirillum cavernae TaxID=2320862 RepID=A0A418WYM3_9BURK|nr:hypothetical protein D3870_04330 [Noviherbaspirillum cavernae]